MVGRPLRFSHWKHSRDDADGYYFNRWYAGEDCEAGV
jgi:hypothetical protein